MHSRTDPKVALRLDSEPQSTESITEGATSVETASECVLYPYILGTNQLFLINGLLSNARGLKSGDTWFIALREYRLLLSQLLRL